MYLKSVSVKSLSLCLLLLSCGKASTQDSQVAAFPRGPGTWHDLCVKSSTGGKVGTPVANTLEAMSTAAVLDGESPTRKCEDVAQALSKMTTIKLSSLGLTDTTPIALVKNLKIILIAENNFKTIAPLTALPKIIGVNVDGNRFPLTCPFKDKNICTGIE
jgi:hypothetical protein